MVYFLDYGQQEAKAVFGNDPRRYNRMTREFIDDGQGPCKSDKNC